MSNLIKSDIFYISLLYIIRLIVISVILLNFERVVLAELLSEEEPFEIWEKSTLQSLPKPEELSVDATITNEDSSEFESNNVIESDFTYSINDSFGLFDESNGGLKSNIWKDSELEDIHYLLIHSPEKLLNSELRNLKLKALMTIATPPIKSDQSGKSFFEVKLDHFRDLGNYDAILQISELIKNDEWSQELTNSIINYHLINSDYKSVCKKETSSKILDEKIRLKMRAFCSAMSNNLPSIDLIISLIKEESSYDDEFIYILSSYLNDTEINFEKIKQIDLLKLNLINNKNIDFSNYINADSRVDLRMFYALSSSATNSKKISLIEDLVSQGIIDINILSKAYAQYLLDNNIEKDKDYSSAESNMEKRIILYNQIRNTSNQKNLVKLVFVFVNEMGNRNLLINSASLIYDKVRIIKPQQEFKNESPSICLILLLNDDVSQCQSWLENLDLAKDAEDAKRKIKYYLSLKLEGADFDQEDVEVLLFDRNILENQKNMLAKHFEVINNSSLLHYWKSENEFNKISTVISNVKLSEYLKNISNNKEGEAILLMTIIHGNKSTELIDNYSLFLILESFNNISPVHLNNFVFEYFANNPI